MDLKDPTFNATTSTRQSVQIKMKKSVKETEVVTVNETTMTAKYVNVVAGSPEKADEITEKNGNSEEVQELKIKETASLGDSASVGKGQESTGEAKEAGTTEVKDAVVPETNISMLGTKEDVKKDEVVEAKVEVAETKAEIHKTETEVPEIKDEVPEIKDKVPEQKTDTPESKEISSAEAVEQKEEHDGKDTVDGSDE